ncbi:MAG: hypothetical protein EBQ71_01465, partial [Betaproteobacteria bacterium]|nr:hypothetical protein [Betaproteobacteria bacterium]
DLVFCRNVLMYFSRETARGVVRRIRQALRPRGFLFLGHAETLRGITPEFHLCHTNDTFYYQQPDACDAAVKATWAAPHDEPAEDLLPEVVELRSNWVDVIQHAATRIATLADARMRSPDQAAPLVAHTQTHTQPHTGSQPCMAAPPRAWDLSLVLEAVRQERFADALELIGSLPADSNKDSDALLLRAVLLTNHGRLKESEEACRRLLDLDELNAGAHYLMALCREHDGDANGAIEHGQTAIYLDPGFAMPTCTWESWPSARAIMPLRNTNWGRRWSFSPVRMPLAFCCSAGASRGTRSCSSAVLSCMLLGVKGEPATKRQHRRQQGGPASTGL